MSWFNALQLALAGVAVALIARATRRLLFEAPLDGSAFLEALETALAAGQIGLARRIADACAPAFGARLAASGLCDGKRPEEASAALDEKAVELEHEAVRGLGAIVALGRIASPLAFIGVILEIGRAFGGGDRIEALQRGLVASSSLERAVFTFSLGVGTFAICLAALAILRRRARSLCDQLRRIAAAVAHARSQ